ncbi:MAG: hypothetical protein OES79_02200 [Planctomycetota bacterium]|nr:hypothetical protein [Planctomycetota bacterium]
MAIIVVCRNCHKRFKVSDQFAGQKGPCPSCKSVIQVPTKDEEVQIHTPEHSEEGVRGRTGELLLEPIAREHVSFPLWAWIAIGVSALVALIVAWSLSGADESTKRFMAGLGAILLAPPLVIAGYTFLRNDELEPYRGLWLWVRTGICAAVYILIWAVYGYLIPVEWTDELWKWAFLGPLFGVAGAVAAFACFDLDMANGFFHFALYVGVTMLLGLIMGLNMFGG